LNKKKIYKKNKDIVGINIKPQFPINPEIIIKNNFDKNVNELSLELRAKIDKIVKKKNY